MNVILENIVQQGEGYFVEFKRSFTKDIGKELVAFANASGGNIYIGIEDNGQVTGVSNINKLQSDVQSLANDCDPPVDIRLEVIEDNVLRVEVNESDQKPHRCTQGFYLRMGANAQKMKTDSILEFIEKEGRVRFDQRVVKDTDFERHFSTSLWK
jgi:ATP-dependent DNA helicase RecG